jgi:hypothetical protein
MNLTEIAFQTIHKSISLDDRTDSTKQFISKA